MTVQDAAKLSQLFYRFWNDTVLPEQAEKACMIAMYYIDENLACAQEYNDKKERARFTRMENDERAARFEKRFGEKLVTKRKEQK